MNTKEKELNRMIDVVIGCCDMASHAVITRELLLGGSNKENIVMTRCILIYQIIRAGYTVTTCAKLLGCTPQAARMLLAKDADYHRSLRAYRLAKEESTRQCDAINREATN